MNQLTKKGKIIEFAVALILILIGVVLRLVSHAPNFTPIAAIALFGGVYFSRKTALFLPIAAMLVSDIFIGFYDFKIMTAVYASFLFSVLLGFWIKKHKKWQTIAGGAVLSALLFFLITNFAVWAFSPLYAKTFFGLIQSYVMALPFFKNSLLGDIFYVSVFFGAYEMAGAYIKKRFRVKSKSVAPALQ